MKTIQVVIPPFIARALESRYDVPKLQSALNADYNNENRKAGDKEALAVNTKEAGISSARIKEGKSEGATGEFRSVDIHKIERSGELNNPRRMTAWLVAFTRFIKTNGEPSTELTTAIIPAHLILWLEMKFLKPEFQKKGSNGAKPESGKRNAASDATDNATEATRGVKPAESKV